MSFKKLIIAAALLFGAGASQASCGSAACALDTAALHEQGRGVGRVGYEFEYIVQDHARAGRKGADVGQIRGHHDEAYTVNRAHRLTGAYGLTERLGIEAALPFISRSHGHVHHHMGQDFSDSWSFGGLGDASASVSWALLMSPLVTGSLGGEFPTGRHRVENEGGDRAEAGVTPGSKSTDLLTGLSVRWKLRAGDGRPVPAFLSLAYKASGKGEEDYRLGDVFTASLGTGYPLGERLSLLAQLNLRVAGRDSRGGTREEVQKTGGEYLFLSPGIEYRWTDAWASSALVQWPVYQRLNQIQLASEHNLLLGLTCRFRRG